MGKLRLRSPCFPTLPTELGLTLLRSGQDPVCGAALHLRPPLPLLSEMLDRLPALAPLCLLSELIPPHTPSSPSSHPAFKTQPGSPDLSTPFWGPSSILLLGARLSHQSVNSSGPFLCHKCELFPNVNSSLKNRLLFKTCKSSFLPGSKLLPLCQHSSSGNTVGS